MQKSLFSAPNHPQWMLLCIQKYDVHIQYHPGKHLVIIETPSRAYLTEQYFPVFQPNLQVMQATQDKSLKIIAQIMLTGWLTEKHELPGEAV